MIRRLPGLSSSWPLPVPPLSSVSIKKAILSSGFRGEEREHELVGSRKRWKNRTALNCAVEKDSEYQVDPDKAREALRKLDEQLLSLSKKKVNPPKIRGVDIKQSIPAGETRQGSAEEELSGSVLASAAAGLLLFTFLYNILFYTVIKPSVDGAPPAAPADVIQETPQPQGGALDQILDTIPLGPYQK